MNFRDEKRILLLKFVLFTLVALTSSVIAQAGDVATDFLLPVESKHSFFTNIVDKIDKTSKFVNRQLNQPDQSEQPLQTYGPVKNNESLWDIAAQLRTDKSASIAQMAIALFLENPGVFINNNINGLLVGVTLSVPDKNQVIRLSKQEAESILQQHWQKWQNPDEQSAELVVVNGIEIDDQAETIQVNEPQQNTQVSQHSDPHTLITQNIKEPLSEPVSIVTDNKENNAIENEILPELSEQKEILAVFQDNLSTTQKNNESERITSSIVAGDSSKTSLVEDKNNKIFELVYYWSQIKFQPVFNDMVHDTTKTISLFWRAVQSNIENNFNQDGLISSPVKIILTVLFVFLLLVYFFRKQEIDYAEVKESEFKLDSESEKLLLSEPVLENKLSGISETPLIDKDTLSDKDLIKSQSTVLVLGKDHEINVLTGVAADVEKLSGRLEDITSELDSNKSPDPKQIKSPKNRLGLLEKVFEHEGFFPGTGHIPEQSISEQSISELNEQEQLHKQEHKTSESVNLLDSVEEIKYVKDTARDNKIAAFLQATQCEKDPSANGKSSTQSLVDEMLANEFSRITDNEKIGVFIEEFEQLISSLTQQAPVLEKAPNEIENLIQFKLSIHFIKVLSEMMQATQLKQFSQMVIEFLDDIVDGNTKMSDDVVNRLSIVVNIYDRYICSVKQNHLYKLRA